MAQSLSEQDLYDLVGAKTHLKPKSVERGWDVIKEIITSELQNNGSINLRNFGTFKKVALKMNRSPDTVSRYVREYEAAVGAASYILNQM